MMYSDGDRWYGGAACVVGRGGDAMVETLLQTVTLLPATVHMLWKLKMLISDIQYLPDVVISFAGVVQFLFCCTSFVHLSCPLPTPCVNAQVHVALGDDDRML